MSKRWGIPMYIKTKSIKGYLIHKSSEKNYTLCRIVKEYDSFEEADKDLLDLLANKTTEKKLMRSENIK